MKKTFILHPFLFALSPILYFFSINKEELSPGNSDFLVALAISLLVTGIMWAVLSVILKNKQKAVVIVSLFVLLFFSYGHVRKLLGEFNLQIGSFNFGPDKTLLSAWGGILLLGSFLSFKTKKNLRTLTSFLNVVAISLVLIPLTDIIPYELKTGRATLPTSQESAVTEEATEITPEEAAKLPDIYYLVFDRYANETILKEHFNFDNSEFINHLKEKGFYVASKACANYPRTFESLASSLNMEYLGYLTEQLGEDFSSRAPVYEMLQDYKVWRFLKKRGYQFIHFGDWYPATKKNKFADININYSINVGSEFNTVFLRTTLYYPIARKISLDTPERETTRKRHLYKFEKLAEIPEIDGPKFIFAHMLIPHSPYVFDKDGNPIKEEQEKQKSSIENYTNQLIFTNKKIEELINELLTKSTKPPIIIIQSDEGPFTPEWSKSSGPEDWRELTNEALKVHIRIINAYYLPDVPKDVLYPSMSPVNSFRTIFNLYFGTKFELLPDKNYIFQDRSHPYKFIDVTDKVKFD
jgi:hypothetical protein